MCGCANNCPGGVCPLVRRRQAPSSGDEGLFKVPFSVPMSGFGSIPGAGAYDGTLAAAAQPYGVGNYPGFGSHGMGYTGIPFPAPGAVSGSPNPATFGGGAPIPDVSPTPPFAGIPATLDALMGDVHATPAMTEMPSDGMPLDDKPLGAMGARSFMGALQQMFPGYVQPGAGAAARVGAQPTNSKPLGATVPLEFAQGVAAGIHLQIPSDQIAFYAVGPNQATPYVLGVFSLHAAGQDEAITNTAFMAARRTVDYSTPTTDGRVGVFVYNGSTRQSSFVRVMETHHQGFLPGTHLPSDRADQVALAAQIRVILAQAIAQYQSSQAATGKQALASQYQASRLAMQQADAARQMLAARGFHKPLGATSPFLPQAQQAAGQLSSTAALLTSSDQQFHRAMAELGAARDNLQRAITNAGSAHKPLGAVDSVYAPAPFTTGGQPRVIDQVPPPSALGVTVYYVAAHGVTPRNVTFVPATGEGMESAIQRATSVPVDSAVFAIDGTNQRNVSLLGVVPGFDGDNPAASLQALAGIAASLRVLLAQASMRISTRLRKGTPGAPPTIPNPLAQSQIARAQQLLAARLHKPLGATDVSGSVPPAARNAGFTDNSWFSMTQAERDKFLAADTEQQKAVANLIGEGIKGGFALLGAGISAAQSQADRDLQVTLAKIAADKEIQLAKINKGSDTQVQKEAVSTLPPIVRDASNPASGLIPGAGNPPLVTGGGGGGGGGGGIGLALLAVVAAVMLA